MFALCAGTRAPPWQSWPQGGPGWRRCVCHHMGHRQAIRWQPHASYVGSFGLGRGGRKRTPLVFDPLPDLALVPVPAASAAQGRRFRGDRAWTMISSGPNAPGAAAPISIRRRQHIISASRSARCSDCGHGVMDRYRAATRAWSNITSTIFRPGPGPGPTRRSS